MKSIYYLAIVILISTFSFSSCNGLSGYSPFLLSNDISVPKVPASLSGGTEPTSGRYINRSVLPQDQWLSEYDQFIIVPEIGHNYNSWLDDNIQPIIEQAKNNPEEVGGEWVEIDNPIFTNEIPLAYLNSGSILRSNDDFSHLEIYVPSDGEQRYLRVQKTTEFTHAMLLMYHTNGMDHSDSVEIIETENKIYTKCVRIHNITTNPLLQHFVAITDKTTSDNKTVGRRMLESSRTDFTFSFTPGDNFDVDYFSQDDTGWGGSGYELYGFFNDNDFYINTTDASIQIGEGYTNPQELKDLFAQGLNNEIVGNLEIDGSVPSGGIEFPDWDMSLIE